jgi:MraZ protein
MIITNQFISREPCLELYPPDEWATLIEKLRERPRFDPRVQAFETFYIAGAHELSVDRQGRILIPTHLREHAKLEKEVTFSANHALFQLWNKALLDKVRQASIEQMMDPEFHAKLGI